MKDYHYILGVPKTATKKEIKAAYRKLSKKFHPDLNEGDKFFEAMFKDINEAYETLLNDPSYSYNTEQTTTTNNESASGNTIEYPVIKQFYTNKKMVFVNDPIKIVWATEHCNLVRLNIIGEVDLSGHKNLKFKKPNANLMIELVASNKLNEKVAQRLTIQIIKDESENEADLTTPSQPTTTQSQEDNTETDKEEDLPKTPQKNKKSSGSLVFMGVTVLLLVAGYLLKDIIQSALSSGAQTSEQKSVVPSAVQREQTTDLSKTAPSTTEKKKPVLSLKKSFLIGSSRKKVLAVQGTPTEINKIGSDELLYYGKSSITIHNDEVIEYSNSGNNLQVRLDTKDYSGDMNARFGIGDTRQLVLSLQGTPSKVKWDEPYETLHYGYSTITIKDKQVVDYSNADNNLKAKVQ